MAQTRWTYSGDINLENGGMFVDYSTWNDGYVNVVEVTDLDSATGFVGAFMIEEKTINVAGMPLRNAERLNSALDCCGASMLDNGDIDDNGTIIRKNTAAYRRCIVYALNAYSGGDVGRGDIVQTDRTQPTEFQGWTAERIRSNGLRAYVRKQFLGRSR